MSTIRRAWNCFRNWKKWRTANALGKAFLHCLYHSDRKLSDIAYMLYDEHRRLFREIHGEEGK